MTKFSKYHDGTLKKCHYCKKPGVLYFEFLAISNFGSSMYFDFHKRCINPARLERQKFQTEMEEQGYDFTPYIFRENT